MFTKSLLVPAFALLSIATAQDTAACKTKTATITSPANIAQYTGCPSLNNVEIGVGAGTIVDLTGPKKIVGGISVAKNAELLTLKSDTIASIGGKFNLTDVSALSTLSFGVLTSVGSINWSGLPLLGAITFPSFITKASSVVITNTFIQDLTGINLMSVDTMDINNNIRLSKFETQVGNITSSLNIAGNSKSLVVTLPNLVWMANATFRDVKALTTPSLETVNGSVFFVNNGFSEYVAPNLTTVGDFNGKAGSLSFVGNNKLANVSFPAIKSIGGAFQVANNSAVDSITMKALTEVGGAVDLSGNFTTPSIPGLKNVQGALHIASLQSIDCKTYWLTLKDAGVVQGKQDCSGSLATATSLDGSSSTTGGSGSAGASPSPSKGAAVSYGAGQTVAGLSVLGGLMSLFI